LKIAGSIADYFKVYLIFVMMGCYMFLTYVFGICRKFLQLFKELRVNKYRARGL
jgi:hypothetical protein